MKIIDNKALLIRTKHGDGISQVIPKSAILQNHGAVKDILVNWGLEEAQILKNFNIKGVPSPILRDYQWPGMYTPFDHQRETAAFLTLHKRSFCFSEAGTGKSNAVIWAADYLMGLGHIKRVLIICPLSIMQSVWQADLFKTTMHRTVEVAYGSKEKRIRAIESGAQFVIINYDGVGIVQKEIEKGGFTLFVIDEANAVKAVNTNRWKLLNKLITKDKWLWMLTGTPAAQSPFDAYGLAKMVNPGKVPKFAGGFRDLVMQRLTQFKWVPRPNAKQIVHSVLQPAIRYTKEECLDLPEITYQDREAPLTPMQKNFYDKIRKDMLAVTSTEVISAVNAAVLINKLLQISSGAAYTEKGNVLDLDPHTRYSVLREVIDECSHKVIVFVNFRNMIEILREKLRKDGVTVECIYGDVSAGERTSIFNRFQTTDNPKVLLIQPQSAAHGVTLHAADTVVWWGPITSAETYLQGNARAHRAGQTKSVSVIHLQGSEVERRTYKLLRQNIDVHSQIVDLYKQLVDEPESLV